MSAERVRVNGFELEYVEQGSGTTIVLSHGGSSDLRYWEPQLPGFAAGHRVVAYSRRFCGAGPWPPDGDNSAAAHVADLVEVVRRTGSGPIHLVGFSTAIGLRAALAEPGLFKSLVLVEPNVPWLLEHDADGRAVLSSWRQHNERVHLEAAGNADVEARLWFELVNNRGPGTFDNQPADLQGMWLDNFSAARPAAPAPQPIIRDDLARLDLPTLLVAAEHGMPFSRRVVDELATALPRASRVVVPGVTHFMSYQNPIAFDEPVLAFIDDVDRGWTPSSGSRAGARA